MFVIFAPKNSLFALSEIVYFVAQFVEGKGDRTLIEGRRCSMDVRYSFGLKISIWKVYINLGSANVEYRLCE